MVEENVFVITRQWLEEHKTERGGYTYAQRAALGYGPHETWKKLCVGHKITLEQKKEFEDGKNVYIKGKKKRGSKKKTPKSEAQKALRKEKKLRANDTRFAVRRSFAVQQAIEDIKSRVYFGKYSGEYLASREFLDSWDWKKLRVQAFSLYGNKCQCCGATPRDGAKLHVDHIKPRKFYPYLALSIDNLQILCSDCNLGKGNLVDTDWR